MPIYAGPGGDLILRYAWEKFQRTCFLGVWATLKEYV